MRNSIPDVVFKTRVRDETIKGETPYKETMDRGRLW